MRPFFSLMNLGKTRLNSTTFCIVSCVCWQMILWKMILCSMNTYIAGFHALLLHAASLQTLNVRLQSNLKINMECLLVSYVFVCAEIENYLF